MNVSEACNNLYNDKTRISTNVTTSSQSGWADFPYAYSGTISIPSGTKFAYIEHVYASGIILGYHQFNRSTSKFEILIYSYTNQTVQVNIVYFNV